MTCFFIWRSFRPTNYSATLHACYEYLSSQNALQRQNDARTDTTTDYLLKHNRFQFLAQFRVLVLLLAENDDWAWQELISRLKLGDLPIDVNLSEVRLPMNPRRLTALADWYGFIRRHLKDDYGGHHNSAGVLLETIVNIGGEAAVQELRRLQTERAFPNPEWLSYIHPPD